MGSGDTVTLTLKGGAPWGFRLQGGVPYPLKVSKIRKKSQAHAQGLQEGDTVVSINGVPLSGRSHDEAMRMVDMSGDILAMEITRGNMPDVLTVAGSHAPVINGHTSVEQSGGRTTKTTTSNFDDGTTKGFIQSQSFVDKGEGRESRGYVHKEQMTSVVQDQWGPTQAPLPSLLDTSLSRQPYSSQPVQVQVSAMFSGSQNGVKDNSTPQGQAGATPEKVQMFNVRKVTSSSSTTTSRQDSWQPGSTPSISPSVSRQEPHPLFSVPDESLYPSFPLPEVKKIEKKAPPPPPPPKPAPKTAPKPAPKPNPTQNEIPIMRVRDVKTQLLSPKSYEDPDDVDSIISSREESVTSAKHQHRMPVFAPPVQISLHAGERDDLSDRPHDLDLARTMSIESEVSSPTSSLGGKSKKIFGDSAFYDDPEKNFPTIQDQMKLCKIIARSLTSAANRKARGAKMFAKRQKKSERWIHDGQLHTFTVTEDIPGYNPHYYDDDEDDRFHLHFKIPSVKQRVSSPETESKMSLTPQEFEKLRLESERCEHHSVSPNQCFDIAQSLKSSKGKAGNMFEKRRQRADKYVIDETNAQKAPFRPSKLGQGLHKPLKGTLTPWEAALGAPDGSVEKAFEELSEFERKQKLNQMLKLKPMAPPAPAPAPRPATPPLVIPANMPHSSLKADPLQLLQGRDFNRKARGWGGFGDTSQASYSPMPGSSSPIPTSPQPQPQQQQQQYQQATTPQFRDFNPKPRAWRTSGEFEPQNQGYISPYASDSSNLLSPSGYRNNAGWGQPASDLPGTDL